MDEEKENEVQHQRCLFYYQPSNAIVDAKSAVQYSL